MHHKDIKRIFFEFYRRHGHKQTPDVSLIPAEHDPSALFTNSGMHPLKPYFLGLQKPPAKRLYNIQKCVRTGDIDDVGNDGRHLTFFFMLGNWSVGDYWKQEAFSMAYDLLVNGYKMNPKKLWASVFKGDKKLGIPKDEESARIWKKIGIPGEKIVALGMEDNFWAGGATGPCGPTSEVHYDLGKSVSCGKNCKPGCNCDRFCEVWNPGVQIAYTKDASGKVKPLKIRSIDGGAGLERIATVLQGKTDIYETTCLKPLVNLIEKLSKKKYQQNKKAMRIVADHVRAAVFITAEGVQPAKKDRGYVLRRLIRRMARYSSQLGIGKKGIEQMIGFVIDEFKSDYSYLWKRRNQCYNLIGNEYDKFNKTLAKGTTRLNKLMSKLKGRTIPGVEVFHLYDTYGFPMELTRELAAEKGFKIDENAYHKQFAKHREVSKKGQTKKFVSGLADHSEKVTKYHTVNHLLLSALQKVLGPKVSQRGSNLTAERLRFDFNWPDKMTQEQIKKTEELVNKWIKQKLAVKMQEMSPAQAKKAGAAGVFEHKYGTKIKVYSIGSVSKEICAGPHVSNTSKLGKFKIIKEKSSSAGVRRIKAVLE